jgi:hypothetical protein
MDSTGGRVPATVALLLGAALSVGAASARAEPAAAGLCHAHIIIGLKQALAGPPDARFVADLEQRSQTRLRFIRAITARLYLFDLSAAEAPRSCEAPLRRLQSDPGVSSAQLDGHVQHQKLTVP